MIDFPCTRCGACCLFPRGIPRERLAEMNWLSPSGSCTKYDATTRRCTVYADRPAFCNTAGMNFSAILAYCDEIHKEIFGLKREQEEPCTHEPSPKRRDPL